MKKKTSVYYEAAINVFETHKCCCYAISGTLDESLNFRVLFEPTPEEINEYKMDNAFWGRGIKESFQDAAPFRIMMLLLMHEITTNPIYK